MDDTDKASLVLASDKIDKPEWTKPEITAFAPVEAAEGISFRPNDGINNLS